jgi:hypothetical protein
MGFFVRRGFSLGPFRINLSSAGVGFSIRLFGATFGINSRRRPYIRFGKFGLGYYEEF